MKKGWTYILGLALSATLFVGGVAIGSTLNPLSLVMDSDKSITAWFSEVPVPPTTYTLNITVEGDGTTIPAPGTHEYGENTEVEVTAIPSEGWQFDRWTIGSENLSSAIIDEQIDASPNDSYEEEVDGNTNADGKSLYIISDPSSSSREWTGLRWDNLAIPQGVTVNICYVKLYIYNYLYDDMNCDAHFELSAEPSAFADGLPHDISNRSRTLSSVPWVKSSMGIGWEESPSLVAPLQEVVNTYSISSLVIILKPKSDIFRVCSAYSWDYNPNYSAQLYIGYGNN